MFGRASLALVGAAQAAKVGLDPYEIGSAYQAYCRSWTDQATCDLKLGLLGHCEWDAEGSTCELNAAFAVEWNLVQTADLTDLIPAATFTTYAEQSAKHFATQNAATLGTFMIHMNVLYAADAAICTTIFATNPKGGKECCLGKSAVSLNKCTGSQECTGLNAPVQGCACLHSATAPAACSDTVVGKKVDLRKPPGGLVWTETGTNPLNGDPIGTCLPKLATDFEVKMNACGGNAAGAACTDDDRKKPENWPKCGRKPLTDLTFDPAEAYSGMEAACASIKDQALCGKVENTVNPTLYGVAGFCGWDTLSNSCAMHKVGQAAKLTMETAYKAKALNAKAWDTAFAVDMELWLVGMTTLGSWCNTLKSKAERKECCLGTHKTSYTKCTGTQEAWAPAKPTPKTPYCVHNVPGTPHVDHAALCTAEVTGKGSYDLKLPQRGLTWLEEGYTSVQVLTSVPPMFPYNLPDYAPRTGAGRPGACVHTGALAGYAIGNVWSYAANANCAGANLKAVAPAAGTGATTAGPTTATTAGPTTATTAAPTTATTAAPTTAKVKGNSTVKTTLPTTCADTAAFTGDTVAAACQALKDALVGGLCAAIKASVPLNCANFTGTITVARLRGRALAVTPEKDVTVAYTISNLTGAAATQMKTDIAAQKTAIQTKTKDEVTAKIAASTDLKDLGLTVGAVTVAAPTVDAPATTAAPTATTAAPAAAPAASSTVRGASAGVVLAFLAGVLAAAMSA